MKNTNESMTAHVEAWGNSGLTKKSYCELQNISYQNFCKFCSRHKEGIVRSGFTLLESKVTNSEIKLYLPNGCYFALPQDCSLSVLQKLVRVC